MNQIERLLPGYNCGECGLRNCREFAATLVDVDGLKRCPILDQERYKERIEQIAQLLAISHDDEKLIGTMNGVRADFSLAPLDGEKACQEDLHPFDVNVLLEPGDFIRYRPLGCPITHFAQVSDFKYGIATVNIVGPLHLLGHDVQFHDIGICMVTAFEGLVRRGRMPTVGETVRFLPEHCMMQKMHSGVVVHAEGLMVRIEAIDLKVW
ncbi:MAG: hypothetical protein LUQ38_11395 [Methanotrichaceae archaeon]|nr:hypothetical protein [Methanotrichaceae archaeon]